MEPAPGHSPREGQLHNRDSLRIEKTPINELEPRPASEETQEKSGAKTVFRIVSFTNRKKLKFSKAQLTIELEPTRVRSTKVSENSYKGLIGEEITFSTDGFVARSPVFRVREKDTSGATDPRRLLHLEGTCKFSVSHSASPQSLEIPLYHESAESPTSPVTVMTVSVDHSNLDRADLMKLAVHGTDYGYKNFVGDVSSDVQESAVEWCNVSSDLCQPINFSVISTEIGFCCTVWYRVLPAAKEKAALAGIKAMHIAVPQSKNSASKSPRLSKRTKGE